MELDNETPTTTYVDEHKCLTALYFDYILMKYPAENEAQAKIEREMNDRCFVERQK
ncbi:MAG TPA: hypothetical protein O0X27_04480 [Methanocorpusculum sp.]|nr:hypothetical protein [Methanocorpusculum sp.]